MNKLTAMMFKALVFLGLLCPTSTSPIFGRPRRDIIELDKVLMNKKPDANGNDRIINGEDAIKGQFPWMAYLDLRYNDSEGNNWQVLCAGTLIDSNIIMTAAHCISNDDGTLRVFNRMRAFIGLTHRINKNLDDDFYLRKIECSYRHPNYHPVYHTKDIALLKITGHVNAVTPATYPSTFVAQSYYSGGAAGKLDILGWGSINPFGPDDDTVEPSYPDILQHSQIHLLANSQCLRPVGPYSSSEVTSQTLCGDTSEGFSGSDSCIGDSGGPLFYIEDDGTVVVVGIVSSGIGCAHKDYPALYTKVAHFSNWIPKAIDELKLCTEGDVTAHTETDVGITKGACKCMYVWAVNDGTCEDGEVVYNHCGMNPACDGDHLGQPNKYSWCFIDLEASDPDCGSAGPNWDYCEIGLGICEENEYAAGGRCHPCLPGSTRPAGDNPQLMYNNNDLFITTTCDVTVCGENEKVQNNECVSCPAGTTNVAGDLANQEDTTCDPIVCAVDYFVSNHVCVPCESGLVNANQDHANGPDTQCTTPPTPSPTKQPTPSTTADPADAAGDDGCSVPQDPRDYFNFLGKFRIVDGKQNVLRMFRLKNGVWNGDIQVKTVQECAAQCIEAGNECVAFEMNIRAAKLQCMLLTVNSNTGGGLSRQINAWRAYDRTTFCTQALPECPKLSKNYFAIIGDMRLKQTNVHTIGSVHINTNLRECTQLCIDHGDACKGVEYKTNKRCFLKSSSSVDVGTVANSVGWQVYDKVIFDGGCSTVLIS